MARKRLKVEHLDVRFVRSSVKRQNFHGDPSCGEGQLCFTEERPFDFYQNGVWVGRFDTSPEGLKEFWRKARGH